MPQAWDGTDVDKLVAEATRAREQAYVPYSGFKVGAALLGADGRIYTGCNVENASHGAANCAERTAVFKAVSEGQHRFMALAVVAATEGVCPPCGICRQVVAEFAPDVPVVLANLDGERHYTSLPELLPMHFQGAAFLGSQGAAKSPRGPDEGGRR